MIKLSFLPLFFLFVINSVNCQDKSAVGTFKVYATSFYANIPPTTITTLIEDEEYVKEISSKEFEIEFNDLLKCLNERDTKKKYYFNGPRLIITYNYSDGSNGYIAANRFEIIDIDGVLVKDKKYDFHKFLNPYIDDLLLPFLKNVGAIK